MLASPRSNDLIEIITRAALANIGAAGVGCIYTVPADFLVSVAEMPGTNGRLSVAANIQDRKPSEIA